MRTRGWSTTGWMLAALACLLILVGGEYAWRTIIRPSPPTTETVRYEWKPQPGEPVKDFVLPDAKKKVHRLSDYKGQDFLLTFFCGCGECRSFTKDLLKAYKDTGRDVPTVAVFTPGFDPAGQQNWIDSTGAKFTYLYSKEQPELVDMWEGTPCPKAYVIGKDQKIRFRSEAPMMEHNQAMVADIAKILDLKFTPSEKKPAATKKTS